MNIVNWRVAAVGGAVVGVAIGGFVLANSDDPYLLPDGIDLNPSDVDPTSVASPLRTDTTLTIPSTTVADTSPDDTALVPAATVGGSPDSPRRADPPPPRQFDLPDSPDSPPDPPSPASIDSPDSPPSPPSPGSTGSG